MTASEQERPALRLTEADVRAIAEGRITEIESGARPIDLAADWLDLRAENERLKDVGIPCELFCPECGRVHIDAPDPESGWTNPPHRTHKCGACGHLWRPYPVATFGVAPSNSDAQRLLKKICDLYYEFSSLGGDAVAAALSEYIDAADRSR